MGGGWHSPLTPLTDHAGHEGHGHEAHIRETDGDMGTHLVAHDLGGHEPNHTFHESRDLPNHSVDGSGPTTVPNGSAAETIGYHFHAGDDVGALAEQSRVLESILGRHVPEAQVAQAAYETGWYDVHRGTSLHDLDRALESHGIAVERSFDTSLSHLRLALRSTRVVRSCLHVQNMRGADAAILLRLLPALHRSGKSPSTAILLPI